MADQPINTNARPGTGQREPRDVRDFAPSTPIEGTLPSQALGLSQLKGHEIVEAVEKRLLARDDLSSTQVTEIMRELFKPGPDGIEINLKSPATKHLPEIVQGIEANVDPARAKDKVVVPDFTEATAVKLQFGPEKGIKIAGVQASENSSGVFISMREGSNELVLVKTFSTDPAKKDYKSDNEIAGEALQIRVGEAYGLGIKCPGVCLIGEGPDEKKQRGIVMSPVAMKFEEPNFSTGTAQTGIQMMESYTRMSVAGLGENIPLCHTVSDGVVPFDYGNGYAQASAARFAGAHKGREVSVSDIVSNLQVSFR